MEFASWKSIVSTCIVSFGSGKKHYFKQSLVLELIIGVIAMWLAKSSAVWGILAEMIWTKRSIQNMKKMLQIYVIWLVLSQGQQSALYTLQKIFISKWNYVAQNSRLVNSSPPDDSLLQAHNMDPPYWICYHAFAHPKQTRVTATCSTKYIKALQEGCIKFPNRKIW